LFLCFFNGEGLYDAIDQQPHAVLLLDEIEKAHPDLFNILLQIMDHGKLTDNNGKSVDFRNVVLIMTSNAGAAEMAKESIGFERGEREGDDEEAIEKIFSPEFRNRLDAIVSFSSLSPDVMGKVVDKFVMELESQLSDRDVTITLTDQSRDWLAKKGYDSRFGARPLSRVIQEYIKKPLSEQLLFGELTKGGNVRVKVKNKDLVFEYAKITLLANNEKKGSGKGDRGAGGKKPELV
jgi:ATPases with chaperone activity, ATP-binding subunit